MEVMSESLNEPKRLYGLEHVHRHGTSFYVLRSARKLSWDDAREFLGDDFEDDREDEFIEFGPVQVFDIT